MARKRHPKALAQRRATDHDTCAVCEQIDAIATARLTPDSGLAAAVLEPMGTDRLGETPQRENDDAAHDDRPI